jgi:hypothetical protein
MSRNAMGFRFVNKLCVSSCGFVFTKRTSMRIPMRTRRNPDVVNQSFTAPYENAPCPMNRFVYLFPDITPHDSIKARPESARHDDASARHRPSKEGAMESGSGSGRKDD